MLSLSRRLVSKEIPTASFETDKLEDKDQATFDGHFKTEYFQTLGKALAEENLLAAPLDIKTVKPFAGFASR